ncbi:MAG: hypothetical protein KDK27_19110, partial [Leptospiraceae bacterium]|nr:hypothetical protein [Leptospiraceae bacterium]
YAMQTPPELWDRSHIFDCKHGNMAMEMELRYYYGEMSAAQYRTVRRLQEIQSNKSAQSVSFKSC